MTPPLRCRLFGHRVILVPDRPRPGQAWLIRCARRGCGYVVLGGTKPSEKPVLLVDSGAAPSR